MVSLHKSGKPDGAENKSVREYTPTHLMDEEEAIERYGVKPAKSVSDFTQTADGICESVFDTNDDTDFVDIDYNECDNGDEEEDSGDEDEDDEGISITIDCDVRLEVRPLSQSFILLIFGIVMSLFAPSIMNAITLVANDFLPADMTVSGGTVNFFTICFRTVGLMISGIGVFRIFVYMVTKMTKWG